MQLQIKLSHGEKPHRSSSLKAGATLRVGRETNAGAKDQTASCYAMFRFEAKNLETQPSYYLSNFREA